MSDKQAIAAGEKGYGCGHVPAAASHLTQLLVSIRPFWVTEKTDFALRAYGALSAGLNILLNLFLTVTSS